jgi:hypothetical protein
MRGIMKKALKVSERHTFASRFSTNAKPAIAATTDQITMAE